MLIKRHNIKKIAYYFLLFLGIGISVILLTITIKNEVSNAFLVVMWSLPTYAIIIGLFGTEHNRLSKIIFQNRFVLFLGKISLELFLIHQLAIRYVETLAKRLQLFSPYMYLIVFIITVVSAAIIHQYNFRRTPKG